MLNIVQKSCVYTKTNKKQKLISKSLLSLFLKPFPYLGWFPWDGFLNVQKINMNVVKAIDLLKGSINSQLFQKYVIEIYFGSSFNPDS